jgi:hypothetical protein
MNCIYGDIPDKACTNYFTRLVDKLFKVIPLKEDNASTVDGYIQDLIYELMGGDTLFEMSDYDSRLIDIILLLQAIKDEDMSHSEYRRAIFKCITLTNQIKNCVGGDIE